VPKISLKIIDNKIILTNKKGIKKMTISKKHYIAISNIIRSNYDKTNNKGEYEPSINTNIISDLATYFKDENLKRLDNVKGARFTFDQVKFVTACFPSRHEDSIKAINKIDHKKIDDEIKLLKAENQFNKDCADQYKKQARVLQSKVKTYEQDIDKGIYVYDENCHCNKCKQQRLNKN